MRQWISTWINEQLYAYIIVYLSNYIYIYLCQYKNYTHTHIYICYIHIYIYISERPGGPTSSQLPPRNPLAAAVCGNPHQHCALEREAKCLLDSFRKRWCQWFPWWHVVLLVNYHSQLWKITIFTVIGKSTIHVKLPEGTSW